MNESVDCGPIWIEYISNRLVHTPNVPRITLHERLVVDETRHGVRDVAVNVRGAAVARIGQTIYARKNSCLNISRRLEAYACSSHG